MPRFADLFSSARAASANTARCPAIGILKQLVVHRKEARHVRWMFRWAGEGKTATEIAALANRKRWRTPLTKAKPRGGRWTPRQVLTTLANSIYAGRVRNGESTLPGSHVAIVTPAEFDSVQEVVASRRTNSRPRSRPKIPWLLRGILRCGQCHRTMSPSTYQHGVIRYRHYRCRSHAGGRPPCPGVSISAHEIETYVIDQISGLSPTTLRRADRRAIARDFLQLWEKMDEVARRECLPLVVELVEYHADRHRIRITLKSVAVGAAAGILARHERENTRNQRYAGPKATNRGPRK